MKTKLTNLIVAAQIILILGIILTILQKLQVVEGTWVETMKQHVYWGLTVLIVPIPFITGWIISVKRSTPDTPKATKMEEVLWIPCIVGCLGIVYMIKDYSFLKELALAWTGLFCAVVMIILAKRLGLMQIFVWGATVTGILVGMNAHLNIFVNETVGVFVVLFISWGLFALTSITIHYMKRKKKDD